MEPLDLKRIRAAAHISWLLPFLTAILVFVVRALGPRPPDPLALVLMIVCLLVLGLSSGVYAFISGSRLGSKAVRIPAVLGILINGLLLFLGLAIVAVALHAIRTSAFRSGLSPSGHDQLLIASHHVTCSLATSHLARSKGASSSGPPNNALQRTRFARR